MNKKNKNFTKKVKVGKFKTPGEIIRDLINNEKVSSMENGGTLKILNTIAPLGNLIAPGVGTAIGATTQLGMELNNNENSQLFQLNKQMKNGGELKGFKQYNAPSHENGGQLVNSEGIPSNNASAEIEGTENSYSYKMLPNKAGSNYVFSDSNKTSDMVKNIISKYKGKDTDTDFTKRAAMEVEINQVEKLNESLTAQKAVKEFLSMKYGGKNKMQNGGPLSPLPNPYDKTKGLGVTQFINDGNQFVPQTFGTKADIPTTISGTSQDLNFNTNNEFNNNINNSTSFENLGLDGASLLRTAGIIAGGIDAFQKPEQDELILPDFSTSDERMNAMNVNLDQARQNVLGASNRASELNRSASGSYSQFRARELGNISNLQDQLGNIGLQEQQLRNQVLGTQGQYEANKANIERNIKQEQQVANLQNKARSQDLKRQFFSDIVSEADRLSTAKDVRNITAAKIEEGKLLLSQIAPDFDVNNSMVENLIKVSTGELKPEDLSDDELIVFTRLNKK